MRKREGTTKIMKFVIFVHDVTNQIRFYGKNSANHNFCSGMQTRCNNKNYEIHDFCEYTNHTHARTNKYKTKHRGWVFDHVKQKL